ncbi:diguanylate cyclase [soil metagenome]
MNQMSRLGVVVGACCLFCAVVAAFIGGLGIAGVVSATNTSANLADDEVATAIITARLAHELDAVYADSQAVQLSPGPAARAQLVSRVYNEEVPAVEGYLSSLRRIHSSDDAAEIAEISRLEDEWAAFRETVNAERLEEQPGSSGTTRMRDRYEPLSQHLQQLVGREEADARVDHERSASTVRRIIWGIVGSVALAGLIFVLLGVAVTRRLRRAIEPAQEQVEFAETLQLAEDEVEAHHLLKKHLQRLVTDSFVTVLNRNNSADRLEAVTALPVESPMVEGLDHARPRSCLAVRSARAHGENDRRPALLGCSVCSRCPGSSTCTPLTVGGEVIGSVLVNRPATYNATERTTIREAVAQAAPVLANLRNLAIAELRASTDSLTGLPNKRAVADTLNRMFAQASRTLSPLSLVVLDLDHFKALNDRFGHPVGDQALANVGAALRSALRDSDFAGRNGGEEFTVLLPDTDIQGALSTAEKIRAAVEDISIPGLDLTLTASLGIATYPEHAVNPDRLERLADAALYVAKRSGRNRVEVATPTHDPVVLAVVEGDVVLAPGT